MHDMYTKGNKGGCESKWLLINKKKEFQNEYWILKKKTRNGNKDWFCMKNRNPSSLLFIIMKRKLLSFLTVTCSEFIPNLYKFELNLYKLKYKIS